MEDKITSPTWDWMTFFLIKTLIPTKGWKKAPPAS